MKRFVCLLLFLITGFFAFSQDIDVYHRSQNDNFNMPQVSWQMDFNEYQILSRDLRMQHMLYAMIMPGYAHFYVKKPTTGWILFASRMAVYGTLLYTYYYAYDNRETATINQYLINANVLWTEFGFIMANYFYDWIHAKYLLDRQKEMIRYKYSMKMQLSAIASPEGKVSPGLGVQVKF